MEEARRTNPPTWARTSVFLKAGHFCETEEGVRLTPSFLTWTTGWRVSFTVDGEHRWRNKIGWEENAFIWETRKVGDLELQRGNWAGVWIWALTALKPLPLLFPQCHLLQTPDTQLSAYLLSSLPPAAGTCWAPRVSWGLCSGQKYSFCLTY